MEEFEEKDETISIRENISIYIDKWVNYVIGEDFVFRKNQKEIIIDIIENVLSEKNNTHVIEAPTGSGKSLINIISAGVLDKYYGRRSFILASDLSLWEQYADFIKKHTKTEFGMLKGKDNYKCQANGEPINSAECKLAGVSMNQLMNGDASARIGFPCAKYCTYLRDRKKALKANVTLLTYALYLRTVDSNNMDSQIQCFDARDVVFCDECHNIPNIIQSRYSFSLQRQDINWCVGLYKYASKIIQPSLFSDVEELTKIQDELSILKEKYPDEETIYNKYYEIYDKLINYRNTKEIDFNLILDIILFWEDFTPIKVSIEESLKLKSKQHIKLTKDEKDILRLCRLHQNYVSNSTIKMLVGIIKTVGVEYLVKSLIEKLNSNIENDKDVLLQCAKEDYMTYMGILSVTPIQVMTSATVGDKDNFDDNIGLKYTENVESKMNFMPSLFNFDKSPIYFLNRYKMSFTEKEKSLEKLKPIIYKICRNFENNRGMIQTGSYQLAKNIIDNAPEDIKSRLLYYNGSKEKIDILVQHQLYKDKILIGPTLTEGIDLPDDLCRFIIITKMPYPSIKDRLVCAKMEIFPYWYNSTTSNIIIQGIGRGVRNENDYCTTYILDACFMKLYTDTIKQYPKEIQDRLQIIS